MFSSPLWQFALARVRSLRGAFDEAGTGAASSNATQPRSSTRFTRLPWISYGLVSFVFFLLLTFPTDLLLRQVVASIEQTASLRIRYKTEQWTWGRGWILDDITLDKTAAAPIQLARLTLRPALFRLLYGQPFPLTFTARLYGGDVQGTLQQTGSIFVIRFTLDQLSLAQWPFPDPWGPGRVSGNLTLNSVLQGERTDLNSWSGSLSATIAEGSLRAGNVGGFPIPALQTAQAQAQATLKDGRIEVSDFTLAADGVTAQLQGTITSRFPLEWSVLDLRLTTQTTGSPPPPLAMLVSLLPAVPGSQGERRAAITGTFAAPVMR
jgi:type II secretion system protein N